MATRLRIGIIGCGAIGGFIARSVDRGAVPGVEVRALYDRNLYKSERLASELRCRPRVARSFEELLSFEDVDLVVEAASQEAVRMYALQVLRSGRDLMVMSVGALVDGRLLSGLRREAELRGRRVYLPSGAILGLDGLKAASQAGIRRVTLTSRKPPRAFEGYRYLEERGVDVRRVEKPTLIFEGPASQACRLFPASVNIASTVSIAGVGPEKTWVRIYVDPTVDRNVHELEVEGEFGRFTVKTFNLPTPSNPKTSFLAALSALSTLRSIVEPLRIG